MARRYRIVILGLTMTSSWGNGHATTYRGLVRELSARGHEVLFLERDKPWYAAHRDMPAPPWGITALYDSVDELDARWMERIRDADVVIVGSYVPDGIEVGRWVLGTARGLTAFYDIDTPVTLAALERGECTYLSHDLVPRYGLYLSFTGGPTLTRLEVEHGSPMARPLYCSVDPELYRPMDLPRRWALGYLGTYSPDRQGPLDHLLLEPARHRPDARFVVVGPQYPNDIVWPKNVERIEHLAPAEHPSFYAMQGLTLNVTRADMVQAGFSPSVRLFEAAACGTPVVSDPWEGLETIFDIGTELLVTRCPEETLEYLDHLPDSDRRELGRRARERVLAGHTAAHRARQIEGYFREAGA